MNNNLNNQNYNFDPMTGQPIQNYNVKNNKNGKIVIILVTIIIAGICILAFTKVMKSSEEKNHSDMQQNQQNSTNQNNNDNNNNTNGIGDSNADLTYDKTGAFLMPIEDIFTITGKGTVISGRIERGSIKIGETIQIIGMNHEIITTTISEIEKSKEKTNFDEAGEYVGVFFKYVIREDIERGQVLAIPNSIKAATKFDAEVYVLSKNEGGRHTPFFNNYRPQFYFRTTDIEGVITLPDDVELVNPGEKVTMSVELVSDVAMEKGTIFSVREGGRIIGKGTIIKVY